MADDGKKKNIAFFHPDLGIGGAERLIIDAAVGLQNRGHKVVIFTSHCDPQHCFDEARDGTLHPHFSCAIAYFCIGTLEVRVRGHTLFPASIFSRFTIICAILRQLHLIIGAYFRSEIRIFQPDAFVVDQLSAGLPLLRFLYPETRILFYCHFPDLLLAQGRASFLKRVYRIPFDFIEQWSMSFADSIAVNSGFTKGIVGKVWPDLAKRKNLQIVYPCVDIKEKTLPDDVVAAWKDLDILLSINRFEKKKDVGLAIKAYAGLGKEGRKGVRLVLAGGYDHRVQENVTYHQELVQLAGSLGLKTATTKTIVTALNVPDDVDVLFLLSVPNTLKDLLLKTAKLLIYTPSNEHFGIVPVEAMLVGCPVLAANTGGPLETVVDGKTGWLCPPDDVPAWTAVIDNVLHRLSSADLQSISEAGTTRVESEFSNVKMAERLDGIIDRMAGVKRRSYEFVQYILLSLLVLFYDVLWYNAQQGKDTNGRTDVRQPEIAKWFLPPFLLTTMVAGSWGVYYTLHLSGLL